jgi:hypothetical protein
MAASSPCPNPGVDGAPLPRVDMGGRFRFARRVGRGHQAWRGTGVIFGAVALVVFVAYLVVLAVAG